MNALYVPSYIPTAKAVFMIIIFNTYLAMNVNKIILLLSNTKLVVIIWIAFFQIFINAQNVMK